MARLRPKHIALLVALPYFVLFLPAPLASQDLEITGATLLDPATQLETEATLWIRAGKIVAVGGPTPADWRGATLDARGKWVIPGLRDFHVHTLSNRAFDEREHPNTTGIAKRALYAGVFGFLDLMHTEKYVLDLRDQQRENPNEVPGAEIFAAGSAFTAPDGSRRQNYRPVRLVTTPDEAHAAVVEYAVKNPDVIKVIYQPMTDEEREKSWRPPPPSIDKRSLAALLAAAQEHDLRTVVHVRTWGNVADAVEAGASAITHVPDAGVVPAPVLAAMRAQETAVIPTLSVADPALIIQPELLNSPLARAVTSGEILDSYKSQDPGGPLARGLSRAQATRFETIRQFREAGVPIVAGTDAGNPLTLHGYSLHRELELYVEAGLSTWEALATATVNAGRFVGRRWGLSVGDEGSVLVLNSSPVERITNTQDIAAIVQRGELVAREELLDQ